MNKEKYPVEDIKKAIAKLKRRINVKSNEDITISMIREVLGCSRTHLHNKKYNEVLAPFKNIKNDNEKQNLIDTRKIKLGTIEYYMYQNKNLHEKINVLENKIHKAIEAQLKMIDMKNEIKQINARYQNEIEKRDDRILKLEEEIVQLKNNIRFLKAIKKENQ